MAGNEWDDETPPALVASAAAVQKTAEQLAAEAAAEKEAQEALEARQAANREAAKAKAREKAAARKTDDTDDEAEEVASEGDVKVKCIVKNGPWTDKKKLAFKETAFVSREIAELMESRDQVVIV